MTVAGDMHRVYRRVTPQEAFKLWQSHQMPACKARFHWISPRMITALVSTGRQIASGEVTVAEIAEDERLLDLVDEHGIREAVHVLGLDRDRLKLAYAHFGRLFPSGPIHPPVSKKARRPHG